jgi:hypothetical protein
METTVGDSISRIRNVIKAVNEDAFVTDRFIYSIINKYSTFVVKKDSKAEKKVNLYSFYKTIPCIELIEVDKVEACCNDIKSNCTIMRSKDKVPKIYQGEGGPLIKSLSSIDGSQTCYLTQPSIFVAMSKTKNFKYNNKKYYWYMNDYFYLPNVTWEAVKVDAIWDDDISKYLCNDESSCVSRQDDGLGVPEYLVAEIEQLALKEISLLFQVPGSGADDKQSQLR